MDQSTRLLIAIVRQLQGRSCRCFGNSYDRWTGAAICDKFMCGQANRPMINRILQFLGNGDVRAGSDLVRATLRTEETDCDLEQNGETLRAIIAECAPVWDRGD